MTDFRSCLCPKPRGLVAVLAVGLLLILAAPASAEILLSNNPSGPVITSSGPNTIPVLSADGSPPTPGKYVYMSAQNPFTPFNTGSWNGFLWSYSTINFTSTGAGQITVVVTSSLLSNYDTTSPTSFKLGEAFDYGFVFGGPSGASASSITVATSYGSASISDTISSPGTTGGQSYNPGTSFSTTGSGQTNLTQTVTYVFTATASGQTFTINEPSSIYSLISPSSVSASPLVATPEPSTFVLAGMAATLGIPYLWRRRRKSS
jgi:PEP-CTERM motif